MVESEKCFCICEILNVPLFEGVIKNHYIKVVGNTCMVYVYVINTPSLLTLQGHSWKLWVHSKELPNLRFFSCLYVFSFFFSFFMLMQNNAKHKYMKQMVTCWKLIVQFTITSCAIYYLVDSISINRTIWRNRWDDNMI